MTRPAIAALPLALLLGIGNSAGIAESQPDSTALPAPSPADIREWLEGTWHCQTGGSAFLYRFTDTAFTLHGCRDCGETTQALPPFRVLAPPGPEDLLFAGIYRVTAIEPQRLPPGSEFPLPSGANGAVFDPKSIDLETRSDGSVQRLPRDAQQLIRIRPSVFSGPRSRNKGGDAYQLSFIGGIVEYGNSSHVRRQPLVDDASRTCVRAASDP